MRVFLAYPSEQRPLAERVNHVLESEGHTVFFDRDDLPAGRTYGDRIRHGIQRCHLFLFLISPESVSPGSYALTELGLVEQTPRRRRPVILPVITAPTSIDRLPAFLRPLTLFEPQGEPVAEIAAKVEDVARHIRRGRFMRALCS